MRRDGSVVLEVFIIVQSSFSGSDSGFQHIGLLCQGIIRYEHVNAFSCFGYFLFDMMLARIRIMPRLVRVNYSGMNFFFLTDLSDYN